MELVEGKTIRQLLFAGSLPIKRVLAITAQVADGLARAHEAGIVHRDLKPENVMVTKDGRAKILDFGLAKLTYTGVDSGEGTAIPTETGTGAGVVLGTVGYMSPEQAGGQPVDFRSDQFSFGSILYEMTTGKRAFHGKTAVDTLSAILNEEPAPIGESNPQAPAPLRWIVERCLAKEPEQRYGTTKDLARDLATLRDHISEAAISGAGIVRAPRRPWRLLAAGVVLPMAVVALGTYLAGRATARPNLPRFQQLTFRHGFVGYARFAPDGQTIVYSASWDGEPPRIFETRPGSFESRALGIQGAILSVSAAGDMALGLFPDWILARAPLAGGAPRELAKGIRWADWAPDGKSLAIIRRVEGKFRLEFPIGKVLYETANEIDNFHVSPEGGRIAFREVLGQFIHVRGDVVILDATTGKRTPTGISSTEFGWAAGGKELWYMTNSNELRAVSPPSGRERVLARFPGFFQLDDIASDDRLLLEHVTIRGEIRGIAPGEAQERSLSWLDRSFAADLSTDGKTVLINSHDAVYLRKTDGSPAVLLGEGKALALSPAGDWALARRAGPPPQLVLLPTGAGETKVLKAAGFESFTGGSFLPDGKRVLLSGTEPGHKPRLYVVGVEDGSARAVSPEGTELGELQVKFVSPDGKLAFAQDIARGWLLYPIDGRTDSSPLPIAGLAEGDAPVGWTADSRSLFVQGPEENPAPVFRVNWTTGKRELFREFRPSDLAGISASIVLITPDAKAWIYSYRRRLSELYLVEGLH
jgi:hypothetical protein